MPKGKKSSPPRKAAKGRSRRALGPVQAVLRWIRIGVLTALAGSITLTLLFRFIPPPATPLMLLRLLEDASEGKRPRLRKDWTPLEAISPHLVRAVMAAEDQNFERHHGFDFEAIGDAFRHNRRAAAGSTRSRGMKGGSTISQQAAKNLFLWPQRSWLRKGLEAYFTLLIETLWPKRRIVEVYLNIIETGRGVYGAEAAAQAFFGKPAARLSRAEAALLAAVLPNPRRWSPERPTRYMLRRQAWILNQMRYLPPPEWL